MTASIGQGEEYEVSLTGITSEGAGVGRLPDGRAIFVHRTAPGDRARVQVTRLASRWARGRLLEVVEEGPGRRSPPCPHYVRCGGCSLEHLAYPIQVELKGRMVTEALARIGGWVRLPAPELHPSPRETRYRNRVSFILRRLANGGVVAGFHEIEEPDRVLDVDGRCLLPEEPVARAWDSLRASWGPAADRLPAGPEIRLTLRGTEGGEVLLLIEGGRGRGDPAGLLAAVPGLRGVWHRSGDPGAPAALLAGKRILEEWWAGERVELHPGSFLQVNRTAAEALHDGVVRALGNVSGKRILDAYCGFGVYGRRAARAGATCVGIETDPAAARLGEQRPEPGFRILEGRVEDRLGEALPADLVVLNPPRGGVAAGVMERMASAAPRRIVYVSCDPATLARDLRRLGDGYRATGLQVYDLFPQTARVETVLTLDRE